MFKPFFCVFLFWGTSLFAVDAARSVELRWTEIEGAQRYEIQVSKDNAFKEGTYIQHVNQTFLEFRLRTGDYFMRVRGIPKKGVPGKWSKNTPFKVRPNQFTAKLPPENAVVKPDPTNKGIQFSWEDKGSEVKYGFEIQKQNRVIVSEVLEENRYRWKNPQSGEYEWRVGKQTGSVVEWDEDQRITVAEITKPIAKSFDPPVVSTRPYSLAQFQISVLGAIQGTGQALVTPQLSWNPSLGFVGGFAVEGFLGVALGKINYPLEKFLQIEYGLVLNYASSDFLLGVGGGLQTWQGWGTYPLLTLQITWRPLETDYAYFDRLTLAYSNVFLGDPTHHQLRAGIGVSF